MATSLEPGRGVRFETRLNQIVDIAAQLFAEHGFHATSVQRLSAATGLQRGALYHYIDGKNDLLRLIHERFIDPLLAQLHAIEAQNLSAPEALRQITRVILQRTADERDKLTVFLHEWRAIQHDAAWEGIGRSRRELARVIENVLEQGSRDGVFKVDDTSVTSLAYFGMVNFSYQWFKPDGRYTAEEIADRFCDIFLNGVLSRPAP